MSKFGNGNRLICSFAAEKGVEAVSGDRLSGLRNVIGRDN